MFNLQHFYKYKSLVVTALAFLLIFVFSFLFHRATIVVFSNNSTIKFEATQSQIELAKFSRDSLPYNVSSITTNYTIDSLKYKGVLYLKVRGFDENGRKILERSNDAFISIAANHIGQNTIRQVILIDSINSKIESFSVFLFNKGGNCGQISKTHIEIQ
ncbi:MAG: hypothetical protein JEZ09_15370 [Salinivirgaceae bacterium]|nr:hypothetical protein [Salinivirgaceae bacterium]